MKITDTIGSVLKFKSQSRILSIAPEQSVFEALEIMSHFDIGALLVLSGDKLLGIISERDYARKGVLLGHLSRETPVSDIMTSPVITARQNWTLKECSLLMSEHNIHHLPVSDDQGELVGMISAADFIVAAEAMGKDVVV